VSAYFQVDASRESKNVSRRGNQPVRRRRFTLERKREIVEQSMKPGASVSRVARDHDVNTNQVFKWRRLHEQGLLGAGRQAVPMLPVRIEDQGTASGRLIVQSPTPEARSSRAAQAGSMEIELRGGRVTVRGVVDRAALRVVLNMLAR
jgi:transposase